MRTSRTGLLVLASLLSALFASGAAGQSPVPGSPNVEIVVNSGLYAGGGVSAALGRYVDDVRLQGYNPILTTTEFADAEALRSHLAERYNTVGLAGAVFIGDLPVVRYELPVHGVWRDVDFPTDLFYQDLNGTWTDADANGRYDDHSGAVAGEIWLGRLLTGSLTDLHPGRTEEGMLNSYFARNHAYRQGQLRISDNGLAYIEDSWSGSYGLEWSNQMRMAVSGEITHVDDGRTTTAEDYKARLGEEFEHVLAAIHSDFDHHRFKVDNTWAGGTMYNVEVAETDPKTFFYNLFVCSGARYTEPGYLAGEYVFGTSLGLLAVGTTKTGGMLEFDDYFRPLGAGETFGEAMLRWLNARAAGGFTSMEKDWHYGMATIGDPLLVTQQYLPIPEPVGAALLAVGAVIAVARRRPR